MVDSISTPRESVIRSTTASKAAAASSVSNVRSDSESSEINARSEDSTETRTGVRELSISDIESSLEEAEQRFQTVNRALRFSVDEGSGRTVIRVIDRETDEVIRQIPPEDVLRIAEQIRETGGGLFSDAV